MAAGSEKVQVYRTRRKRWQDAADALPPGKERDQCLVLAHGYDKLIRLIQMEDAQTGSQEPSARPPRPEMEMSNGRRRQNDTPQFPSVLEPAVVVADYFGESPGHHPAASSPMGRRQSAHPVRCCGVVKPVGCSA